MKLYDFLEVFDVEQFLNVRRHTEVGYDEIWNNRARTIYSRLNSSLLKQSRITCIGVEHGVTTVFINVPKGV